MPTLAREPIYAALFTALQTVSGILTFSRTLKHWEDVAQPDQPALFMTQIEEDVTATALSGLGDKVKMRVRVYLYVYNPDQDPASTPWVKMNQLLDAIHQLFKPTHGARRHDANLNGLVDSVRISGKITTDEGWLGPQAVAIVPIEISVTAT